MVNLGGLSDYQRFDKIADLAYVDAFPWMSCRWSGPAIETVEAIWEFIIPG